MVRKCQTPGSVASNAVGSLYRQITTSGHEELCLSSERGVDIDIKRAVPVSGRSYSGTCVSAAPTFEPAVVRSNVPHAERVTAVAQTVVTTCASSKDCADSTAPRQCLAQREVSLLTACTNLVDAV